MLEAISLGDFDFRIEMEATTLPMMIMIPHHQLRTLMAPGLSVCLSICLCTCMCLCLSVCVCVCVSFLVMDLPVL